MFTEAKKSNNLEKPSKLSLKLQGFNNIGSGPSDYE